MIRLGRKGGRFVLCCATSSAFWACAEYLGTSVTIGLVVGMGAMAFFSLRHDHGLIEDDLDRVRTTQLISISEKDVEL